MNRAPLPAMTRFEFRESVWLNAAHAVVYSVFALPAGLGFYAKGVNLKEAEPWLGRTNWLERKNFSVQSSKRARRKSSPIEQEQRRPRRTGRLFRWPAHVAGA
jgi:hypothetical protein